MNLIVALCKKNNGIGFKNAIPWHLKTDLKYFKETTTSQVDEQSIVIMGRKTWESLPIKPLPNRINVVISRNEDSSFLKSFKKYDNTFVSKSINDILQIFSSVKGVNHNMFVIGGEEIYKLALESNLCNQVYITEIYNDYECDSFFPIENINKDFSLVNVSKFQEENGVYFRNKVFKHNSYVKPEEIWKNKEEYQYINTMIDILNDGIETNDRTQVGTLSLFGKHFRYDLSDTFPALTTKRIFMRGIFEELMMYLTGKTDNGILNDKNINIWDGNTTREFLDKRGLSHYPVGDMGETYGFNFRHFGAKYVDCKQDYTGKGTDQLQNALNLIKNDPNSRRIIINLWNAATLNNAALPACLCMYQFYVNTRENKLNLQIYIRSSDFFLANNWNVCTGAFLVHMICNLEDINLTPGILTVCTGDTHIYKSHIEQVKENISRVPKPFSKLIVKEKKKFITDFTYEDFKLIDYKPEKNISAPMAV